MATGLDEGVGPRALSGRGHALLGEAPLRGLAGAEGVAAAAGGEGDEDEDADVLGQLPPLLPPPYPEPSAWSGGSLHALGQQVAHTIRTSWGMGEWGCRLQRVGLGGGGSKWGWGRAWAVRWGEVWLVLGCGSLCARNC